MKRSEINALVRAATSCFAANGWTLPPSPKWDVTDFGLGSWQTCGLVLVNLAEEAEYCEKLMYAKVGMTTPAHAHRRKKEDIICRWGSMKVTVWPCAPGECNDQNLWVQVNGQLRFVQAGEGIELLAGERITLVPGIYHEFVPTSEECIIGEVSTANDDLNDNFFVDRNVGRFSDIEEDEEPIVTLVSDK